MSSPSSTRPEIIMVMGVHRSGTSVLFNSLATDKTLSAFPEEMDSAFYYQFRLRPAGELAPLIEQSSKRILLKPITETNDRSLAAVAEEYRNYSLRFVWIYRDPVNVLHSMHRKKWIAARELAQPEHFLGWRKRNEYALQLQQQSPADIAIVRYEDLCLDPAVFGRLARWLRVSCTSFFRRDLAEGRRRLSPEAQRQVDAATAETLRALDSARTFKPRWHYRLRDALGSLFAARARPSVAKDDSAAAPLDTTAARSPASIRTLEFWLEANAICDARGNLNSEIVERGPNCLRAAILQNGPYGLANLNRKGTLYYPHNKVEARRCGASGTLVFEPTGAWNALFDDGFTFFALFRPNIPFFPPFEQQRATLLRLGERATAAPAFLLQWDAQSQSSRGVMIGGGTGERNQAVIEAPRGSHPTEQWRVTSVKYSGAEAPELHIAVSGVEKGLVAPDGFATGACHDCSLEVGGWEAEKENLFYGQIAEIILFRGLLGHEEQAGVERYLNETYQL